MPTQETKEPTRRQQVMRIAGPLSLFFLLLLPVTPLTQLLLLLVGGVLVLGFAGNLAVWFVRWFMSRMRKKQFSHKPNWLGIGLALGVYAIVIALHLGAISRAEQLAFEVGVQIQKSCQAGKECSIPQKYLEMGMQASPAAQLKIYPDVFLGKGYPVRIKLMDSKKVFVVRVYHYFQHGFAVFGGKEERFEMGNFSE